MAEAKRKPGRPTSIDKQAAMSAIVELFRSKGLAAVSLDDLSDATGLSRPSLYRAFGSKLSMYLGAIDAFGVQVSEVVAPALESADDLETALVDFFQLMLAIYYRDKAIEPGCLLFGTAPSSAYQPAVQSRLELGIEQIDGLMRTRILRAAPSGNADMIETAISIASNTLIAFSARAKSGATKADLTLMGARSVNAISLLMSAEQGQ